MPQKIELFSPPFIQCPYCGVDAFGISHIGSDHYTRRCNSCWRPKGYEPSNTYELPKLSKKIIYLDQFALSNIAKILSGIELRTDKDTRQTWKDITGWVSMLVQAQLIVCPSSWAHEEESTTAEYYEILRRLSNNLACGVHFYHFDDIRNRQVYSIAGKYFEIAHRHVAIERHHVMHGELNEWQERFFFGMPKLFDNAGAERLRADREQVDSRLQQVYTRWQSENNRSFEDWFSEENESFGTMIWKQYFEKRMKMMQYRLNPVGPTNLDVLPNSIDILVYSIMDLCGQIGISGPKALERSKEFLHSVECRQAPCTINESLLWAAIARKLANGQKRMPTRGIRNDVNAIAHLYPYCDAMFVDKECYSLLREQPLPHRMIGSPRLFSLANVKELIEYLKSIENEAPVGHFEKVSEVYGDWWKKPLSDLSDK